MGRHFRALTRGFEGNDRFSHHERSLIVSPLSPIVRTEILSISR
jgi:hypothetical protein